MRLVDHDGFRMCKSGRQESEEEGQDWSCDVWHSLAPLNLDSDDNDGDRHHPFPSHTQSLRPLLRTGHRPPHHGTGPRTHARRDSKPQRHGLAGERHGKNHRGGGLPPPLPPLLLFPFRVSSLRIPPCRFLPRFGLLCSPGGCCHA